MLLLTSFSSSSLSSTQSYEDSLQDRFYQEWLMELESMEVSECEVCDGPCSLHW